mmetsp:Transcript_35569/g.113718  ORF Transcript_35569/g.113718 Transcript_35569/m.113718 type:complete len:283 (-) Transcript_35569:1092-1940(-)
MRGSSPNWLLFLAAVVEPFYWPTLTTKTRGDAGRLRLGRWDPPSPGSEAAKEELLKDQGTVDAGQLLSESYVVSLPGATGIEWGSDLTFTGVYVRDVQPNSPSFVEGVRAGDQLVAVDGTKAFDLDFDAAMSLALKGARFEFLRGTRATLLDLFGLRLETDDDVTVTVLDDDDRVVTQIKADKGANLRQVLVDSGLDVYRGSTKYLNCAGKQLCGTCIVDVVDGGPKTNFKSNDELATLTLQNTRPTCRLSCVTFLYGDVSVRLQPERSGFFGAATSGSGWS